MKLEIIFFFLHTNEEITSQNKKNQNHKTESTSISCWLNQLY